MDNSEIVTRRQYLMVHSPFTVKDVMDYYDATKNKDRTYSNVITTLIAMQSQYADTILEAEK